MRAERQKGQVQAGRPNCRKKCIMLQLLTCVYYRLIHKCSDKCGLTLDMILAMAEPRYAQKKAAEEKGGREILSDDITVCNSDCR